MSSSFSGFVMDTSRGAIDAETGTDLLTVGIEKSMFLQGYERLLLATLDAELLALLEDWPLSDSHRLVYAPKVPLDQL